MIVIVGSAAEVPLARRLLSAAEHKLGAAWPDSFRNPTILFDDNGGHPPPPAANFSRCASGSAHAALMSHADVASELHVSTRTVQRRVREGRLTAQGRKITAESVRRYASGEA